MADDDDDDNPRPLSISDVCCLLLSAASQTTEQAQCSGAGRFCLSLLTCTVDGFNHPEETGSGVHNQKPRSDPSACGNMSEALGPKSLLMPLSMVRAETCNFRNGISVWVLRAPKFQSAVVIAKAASTLVGRSNVQFGGGVACASIEPEKRSDTVDADLIVRDRDFEASFDGRIWTVKYHWIEGKAPVLKNKVSRCNHEMSTEKVTSFEQEVEKWINEGILMPWDEEVDEGIIPLMAVDQVNKNKVRPVLDFRELNEAVECHTGDDLIDVCDDVLRQWRQVEGDTEIVDLKAAYLQLHVSRELWKYQLVRFTGKSYCLTRLGFGLNCAPRIMTKVLKTVLEQRDDIRFSTSSYYIDDILVSVSQVSSEDVISHLRRYGLVAKPAEKLEGGTALGLKLFRGPAGRLWFGRSGELPRVNRRLTKRELFSLCGKLTAHYPIAGWLRLACSYVKRHSGGEKWDSYICDRAQVMVEEIVARVGKDDPVRGEWGVEHATDGTVWCDASYLCEGVNLEIDGVVAEDAAWMGKPDDYHHINVAELDAVLKGVNLGVKWGLKDMFIMTDSVTVGRWIDLTLSEERRVKTAGAAEILVKRRLAVLKEMVEELGLTIRVQIIGSKGNKADAMTRVTKEWKEWAKVDRLGCGAVGVSAKELHDQHHFGVERSWYLARQVDPRWNVRPFFRAAYRPGGNGIEERNHRTIKAIAERGNMSPVDAVFYYNCSPRYRQEETPVLKGRS
ncbi:uncharacterized protein LOC118478447 [Aplysia californica]|uniref:Uncharacterized protein LOC118478447 n=1 Tax=Aplysia californica TaxID=6500 RepID=A0ABM1VZV6_APLCA|nr:uncharacterized protein LOC118478447 [Aplysia californica]